MKLYEIGDQYLAALQDLSARVESGELDPAVLADTMEGLQGEWEEKALNVAKYIATLEAEAAAIKTVEEVKAARRKLLEAQADRLRAYLSREAERLGIYPKDAEIAIAPVKSQAVQIDDETQLPADYWREIPARREPDKALIKQAIKDGFRVPGAHIEHRHSVRIK
ncbi:siphovirus Gp157 family protein [Chitiniphilus purpureus]|uniref:Siphovirus Gp157 family protein n=1 Tax=Chitiniphilus purpureus TaxID=2981137 RepID=A0ABY6DK87_9NEIS|nr:siphovirus Gp157 family protein [Chitiniphilus sp. CD1]UXY14775.1 siphovirus Gp157 family protein [Chitiniphilus sp. CD1]